jgi:NADPH:quinone reductase-like Zn-dependent oxidoreductase
MKAFHLDSFGESARAMPRETADPAPAAGEVLIRVRARSLNFRDLLIARGLYPVPARAGVIPLSDGAGEVAAVGAGVTRFAVGDLVSAAYFPRWIDGPLSMDLAVEQFGCTRDGMLADLVVASEQSLVKIPTHLSFAEAATLPCAGVTAWSALVGGHRVQPGQSVLIIGTGGVAMFAAQFARMMGARVIAVTSSEDKAKRLLGLGVHEVVNRSDNPDWERNVRALTGGRGVDHIVETGALETLPRSIAAAASGAEIALVAALGAGALDPRLLGGLITIRRVYVGSRSAFEQMNRAIELHALRPAVDRVFPFAEAGAAYAHFSAKQHVGKVVIAD